MKLAIRLQMVIGLVLLKGALGTGCLYASEPAESVPSDTIVKNLGEVVVEARKEIHTSESDIIYLSKRNREFGTNALDAISSLRQFASTINGTTLSTINMKPVAIMINGRPAAPQDLLGYSGNDIKLVRYYPVAPPRYSDITDGPLLEVEMKSNKDYISAFLSASNSINTGYGTNQMVIRWADSLNLVRADYFIDYRNLTYDNRESYGYPSTPSLSRDYSSWSRYKGHYQYGKISWENTTRGNIIYLSARFTNNPGRRTYNNTPIVHESGTDVEEEFFSRLLESSNNVGNLNFFFRKNFRKGRLDIQANGSVGRVTSDNSLVREGLESLATSFNNDTYRAYGKLLYYRPVRKLSLFVNGSYSFQRVNRHNIEPSPQSYTTDYNTVYLSTSISGSVRKGSRKFSYNAGIGFDYKDMDCPESGLSIHDWWFTPNLTLGASLSKRLFIRLRANIKSGMPIIGQLTDNLTYRETNLAWSGNRDLKGWRQYAVNLYPELVVVPSRFTMNGDFSFRFLKDPVMECVTDDNPVVIRPVNVPDSKYASAVVYMNVGPFGPLSIKPYLEWDYSNFRTLSRRIDRGYFRYGGSVSLSQGIFQSLLQVNAPYRLFSGDKMEYGNWQIAFVALVKLPRSVTVSLTWRRSQQDERTEIYAPGILNYVSVNRIPRMANQIMINLTWNFSHGIFKKRKHPQVSDMNPDSGLTDFNEAKM